MKTLLFGSTMALCAVFLAGVGTHPTSAIKKPSDRKCVVGHSSTKTTDTYIKA